jgi:predicted ribosome quality control (RQC) complex YloA/Tae2 family protein
LGRHFRLSPQTRAIVGRDEGENARIVALADAGDILFEVPDTGSPVTLLRGEANEAIIRATAAITARYSDARAPRAVVRYGSTYPELDQQIEVDPLSQEMLDQLRI